MGVLTLRAEDIGLSEEALARLKAGDTLEITQGGSPIASIHGRTPPSADAAGIARREAASAELFAIRDALRAEGRSVKQDDIRAWRDDHGSDPD